MSSGCPFNVHRDSFYAVSASNERSLLNTLL